MPLKYKPIGSGSPLDYYLFSVINVLIDADGYNAISKLLQIKSLRTDMLTAVDLPHGHSGKQNTEAGTKFRGLNIQKHFLEWKYSNFTEFLMPILMYTRK